VNQSGNAAIQTGAGSFVERLSVNFSLLGNQPRVFRKLFTPKRCPRGKVLSVPTTGLEPPLTRLPFPRIGWPLFPGKNGFRLSPPWGDTL